MNQNEIETAFIKYAVNLNGASVLGVNGFVQAVAEIQRQTLKEVVCRLDEKAAKMEETARIMETEGCDYEAVREYAEYAAEYLTAAGLVSALAQSEPEATK